MQKDFHFYATMVLARAAGFNADDARIIATASQYVDDSTEYQPIDIKVNGYMLRFDPTCSSYDSIDLSNLDWTNQKKVWIPFHFLPERLFKPRKSLDFSYVTAPASIFARSLLKEAIHEPLNRYKLRLVRIGIAMHTYGDSFSHSCFSGRHNKENNVQKMALWRKNNWDESIFRKTFLNLAPQIGHAEAGCYPDYPFQKWRCKLNNDFEIKRDNVVVFLEAAESMYFQFTKIRKLNSASIIVWPEIKDSFKLLFQEELSLEERVERWRKEFQSIFPLESDLFFYDKNKIRGEALTGDLNWDNYSRKDWDQEPPRIIKGDISKNIWFLFHKGALRQRHLVLENIP